VSYGLKPPINPDVPEQTQLAQELAKAIPRRHLEFLESLNLTFSCGDFLFVHAGIRPGVPIRKQSEEDLLWIREEFLSSEQRFEKFVVHGHTPVRTPDIRSNRINIDTGAFATGRLTCIVIEGTSIVELIDVRDWIRNAAGIGIAQNTQTRMEPAAWTLATQILPGASKHDSRGPVHGQVDGENAFSVERFRLLALLRILGGVAAAAHRQLTDRITFH
jgi:hypothetical protein